MYIQWTKLLFTCSLGAVCYREQWGPFPLTGPSVSQLQQWAEGSCQCRIIKTSVEVTGSLGGMQHSKAPLLSCFLCELSRPLRIYSSMAQHSPLPLYLPDRCHLQATISGAKHNAFSSLTSCTHRQSAEQQESEDNINVASFTLTLPGRQEGRQAAVCFSHWTMASLHNSISQS